MKFDENFRTCQIFNQNFIQWLDIITCKKTVYGTCGMILHNNTA